MANVVDAKKAQNTQTCDTKIAEFNLVSHLTLINFIQKIYSDAQGKNIQLKEFSS